MKLVLHFDGGSRGNPGPAGAGVVLGDVQGQGVYEAGFYLGRMTNNMAEYSGLVKGLEEANRRGARELTIFADSELVVRQLNGDYRVKNEKLRPLYEAALRQLRHLDRWVIRHIPREQNRRADELANTAMDAGKDVIELAAGDSACAPERAAKPARAKLPREDHPPDPRAPRERSRTRRTPEAGPAPKAAERTGVVVVRCLRPARTGACPVPCDQSARLVFDQVVPAGLCLDAAATILRAVETVRGSRKPARVYCSREGCGACFSVVME